jgi:hypothetical protein
VVLYKKKECNELSSETPSQGELSHPQGEDKGEDNQGTVWIWTSIDTRSRLIINYWIGKRQLNDARHFLSDLSDRIIGKPLFVSDELCHYKSILGEIYSYKQALEPTKKRGRPKKPIIIIDDNLLYATVHKIRKNRSIVQIEKKVIYGTQDKINDKISDSPSNTINTSYIE